MPTTRSRHAKLSSMEVQIRHGCNCSGAERHGPAYSYRHYGTGRKHCILVGHAQGSQGYVCLPDPGTGGTSWTINAARPEATLFTKVFGQDVRIITHFASINANANDPTIPVPLGGNATWQSSFDTSKVWAKAVGKPVVAGTDPASCPSAGAIPCLLLQSVRNQQGPTGGKLLADVTFVQRLNTKGGSAPTTACTVGQTQLQGYSADYFFYHKDQ